MNTISNLKSVYNHKIRKSVFSMVFRAFDPPITSLSRIQSNQKLRQKQRANHCFNLSIICVGCLINHEQLWSDLSYSKNTENTRKT